MTVTRPALAFTLSVRVWPFTVCSATVAVLSAITGSLLFISSPASLAEGCWHEAAMTASDSMAGGRLALS